MGPLALELGGPKRISLGARTDCLQQGCPILNVAIARSAAPQTGRPCPRGAPAAPPARPPCSRRCAPSSRALIVIIAFNVAIENTQVVIKSVKLSPKAA